MRRLYTRVYLHLLGAVFVVGLVTSVVFAHGWRSALMHAWALRFTSFVASTMGEHCTDAVERHRLMERTGDGLDIDLTFRDPAGRLLDHEGPVLPFVTAAELSDGPQLMLRLDHSFWVSTVRRPDGQICGVVESFGRRPVHAPGMVRPIATVALVLLLVAAGAVPLARRISRPVEALTEGSRRLAQGDLGYRVPIRRAAGHDDAHSEGDPGRKPDQLDELTRAWNEMAERIEHLVRGQRELLANVSHEFRSPLTRIRMALELLPQTSTDAKRVAGIESDLDELNDLIETLLTASRLEESGLPTHISALSLRALFDELEERAHRSPLLHDQTLIVTRPSDDAAPPLYGDGRLLGRLLYNLVENAAKYGHSPISVSAERLVDGWQLMVSDQGPGIPAAERERVFEPFVRLSPAPTRGGASPVEAELPSKRGFGLGLTLAHRIVQVHGGTIRIESTSLTDDRGCRIVIELPDELPATRRTRP